MRITILTMFPEMLESLKNSPILQHALQKGKVKMEIVDIRDYAKGSFRHLDDSPYGGGAGMIMRVEPLWKALQTVKDSDSYTVIPTPCGEVYNEKKARRLAEKKHLILVCGHYEGIDERVYSLCDERISIGDYIMSGGEYAAMNIVDSIVRLLPGVIKKDSTEDESFENNLLEYPQYTRPLAFEGMEVPEVLRSGDHEAIRKFRLEQSLLNTYTYRKDLLERHEFTEEEKKILADLGINR